MIYKEEKHSLKKHPRQNRSASVTADGRRLWESSADTPVEAKHKKAGARIRYDKKLAKKRDQRMAKKAAAAARTAAEAM